jgi:toxin ParE1/3/4
MAATIESATERLGNYPEMVPRIGPRNTRRLVVPGTPYVVLYRLSSDEISVIAVTHGARSA